MAYSLLTTVTSHDNLIDQIETFLLAEGWTVETTAEGPPRKLVFYRTIDSDACYFSIISDTANSRLRWNAYTGSSEAGISGSAYQTCPNATIVEAHLFSQSDSFYVVLKTATNTVYHGGCGRLTLHFGKATSEVTGVFVFAQASSSHVGLGSGSTNYSIRIYNSLGSAWTSVSLLSDFSTSYNNGSTYYLLNEYENFNHIRPMVNINVAVAHGVSGSFMFGYFPNLKATQVYPAAYGEDVTVGVDTWTRFYYRAYTTDYGGLAYKQ